MTGMWVTFECLSLFRHCYLKSLFFLEKFSWIDIPANDKWSLQMKAPNILERAQKYLRCLRESQRIRKFRISSIVQNLNLWRKHWSSLSSDWKIMQNWLWKWLLREILIITLKCSCSPGRYRSLESPFDNRSKHKQACNHKSSSP